MLTTTCGRVVQSGAPGTSGTDDHRLDLVSENSWRPPHRSRERSPSGRARARLAWVVAWRPAPSSGPSSMTPSRSPCPWPSVPDRARRWTWASEPTLGAPSGGQRVEHAREHGWHHRHEQAEAYHHHDQPDEGTHEPRERRSAVHDDEGSHAFTDLTPAAPDPLRGASLDAATSLFLPSDGVPDGGQQCRIGRGRTGSRSWHGSRPALPSRGRARRAGRSTTPPAWRLGRPRHLAPSAGHRTRLPGCRPGTTPA